MTTQEIIKSRLTNNREEVIASYNSIKNPRISMKDFFMVIFNAFQGLDEDEEDKIISNMDVFKETFYSALAEAEEKAGYDWHDDMVKVEELTPYEKKAYDFYTTCKSDSYFAKVYGIDLLRKFQENAY